jgi:hypothetical protein
MDNPDSPAPARPPSGALDRDRSDMQQGRPRLSDLRDRTRPALRDAGNRLRRGRHAPRFAERLWVVPAELDERVFGVARHESGRLVGGDWDLVREPVEAVPKVASCLARWGDGRSWEDAGAYAFAMQVIAERGRLDGCTDLDQVRDRYDRLDAVFVQVRREGRLRTRCELDPVAFRELGGVLVNVDRHGAPVAGGGGWHRLAMARVLDLPVIPAQVGRVHATAPAGWRDRLAAGASSPPPRLPPST